MTIALALICAFMWGYSEVEHKKASSKFATPFMVLLKYIFQILSYLIFILIFDLDVINRFDLTIYKFIIPFFLLWFISNLIYNYCLKNGKLSIVSPLMASDPVFVVIIGLILFKEKQSIIDLIALAIICISICGLNFVKTKEKQQTKKIAIFLASLYAFFLALATTVEKSIYLGGYTLTDMFFHYMFLLMVVVFVLSIYLVIKKQIKKPNKEIMKSVVITNVANILYSYLISTAYVSLVVPLTGLYSVVTQVLAKIMLKEKLTISQRTFVSLIIVATLLLLIF